MSATRTKLTSLAATAVALSALGARTTGASSTTEPTPDPSEATTGGDFSVVAALAELPADLVDEAPLITMGDVAAASDAAGLVVPDAATSDDFVDDYIHWMLPISGTSSTPPGEGEPTFVPVPVIPPGELALQAGTVEELRSAVGFTFADVEWFADVSYPPTSFTVFAGAFGESTLPAGLTPVGDGIVSLGEGDDFAAAVDAPNPLSRIGVAQRLAYDDGRIAVSPDTTLVDDWLAGAPAATGAHDDDLVTVATALDDAGVISAVLGSLGDVDDALGPTLSPAQREALLARLGDAMLGDSFDDTVGIGWHAVAGESVITIVYMLADDVDAAGAEAAVETVRHLFEDEASIVNGLPMAEYLVVDDIATDGTVVTATLHPGPEGIPLTPYQMIVRGDLPFVTLDD